MANLLYFIHPTLVSPVNTAIVRGNNAVTGANVKLGRWDLYLSMREGLVRLNQTHRQQLSNDLGALAGLMFDVGNGRYAAPPRLDDPDAMAQCRALWEADLNKVREESSAAQKQWQRDAEGDATHTDIQGRLRDLDDRGRAYGSGRLGDGCLADLPASVSTRGDAVRLIDVIWLENNWPGLRSAVCPSWGIGICARS